MVSVLDGVVSVLDGASSAGAEHPESVATMPATVTTATKEERLIIMYLSHVLK
jgi:hypothetical protein